MIVTPAGRLNRRIRLEYELEEADELGAPLLVWRTYREVWANVRFYRPAEPYRDGRADSTTSATFKVRRRAGFEPTANMRVVFQTEVFSILRIENPAGENRELWIHCSQSGPLTRETGD